MRSVWNDAYRGRRNGRASLVLILRWAGYRSRCSSEMTDGPVREDATRRTYLTQERTLLAWLRSGLAAFPACGYVLDQC